MKHKLLLLAAMMLATMSLFAQSANNEDEVVKIDRWNQQAYREGEILVKFRAEGAVQMRAPRKAKFQSSQVSAIDQLFTELGVDSIEQLMPMTGHKNVGRRLRTYNGSTITTQDLSKLYRLTLKPEKARDIHAAIERLKAMDEVEFAEPNYIVYTMALPYNDSIPTNDSASYVNESPLYSQQWGLQAINLPALWNKPKRTNKRPVIAILDTGVDIEHPDLAANIWTNTAEANGISGQDDDANGFKDDLHGWDFINNHSVTNDFNGHGTHCAGIAAAVGKNGIGITGANPDALIMPVTVMQSNGTGDVATIVKGIDYAVANGADVISMSIGSYAYSGAEEQALANAYSHAILVGAAGNDGASIYPFYTGPLVPAAFSFVLGVEASINAQGALASFSNIDPDGPIYSKYAELYNYELRAPGKDIISTFPGGRYKKLNGTSMACPLVAGAVSRLIQCKEYLSPELLFGDLIHTRNGNVNLFATYNIKDSDRHPELALVTTNMTDTLSGDGDNRADAGEMIEFYPIFKNAWGQAENIRFWIKVGFDESGDWVWDDTTLIHALQDTVYFGKPLSSYAKATSKNPYRMIISPDCPDARKINLTLFAICDNAVDTLRQQISIEVENGVELGGMITEDMTLYPNVHYILTNNIAIPAGVTLTIKPGTIIKTNEHGISVTGASHNMSSTMEINGQSRTVYYSDTIKYGRLIANGTPDSMIVFEGRYMTLRMNNTIPYYIDTQTNQKVYVYNLPHLGAPLNYVKFNIQSLTISGVPLYNCYFDDCQLWENSHDNSFKRCTYTNGMMTGGVAVGYERIEETNIANAQVNGPGSSGYSAEYLVKNSNFYPCTRGTEQRYCFISYDQTPRVITLSPNFYGTAKESEARKYMIDIEQNFCYGYYDISNMLTRPVSEAHGIVWKILVDGIDAQDEFKLLPPIGVGTHRCDVYFNRPMNVSIIPNVSFGVRSPYTQHQVAENGSWSADSTIYTAYFTIDAKSMTDGLNTFRVYGAEDTEHFTIPEENWRYRMEVAATGSMSTGLMAEAGLGKVTLNWETDEEDFADLLGYNIYRWTNDTIRWDSHWENGKYISAGWRIDTLCINPTLIDSQDTTFVDYDVVPGKAYYYQIRQVTTSLNTYDISNPVTATPLTAIKGDANGSMAVDVADVITEVNYITHQNPQPFIFEAADVNSDNQVNIIDVVGTVNLILHPNSGTQALNDQPAHYYIENGILYVETDVVLGGVQCTFNAEPGHQFTVLDALQGFETVSDWQTENDYLFMAYSMSGKTLGVGRHALLQIGDAEMTNIVLSDAQGHNVQAVPQASTALDGTIFLPCSEKYIRDCNFYIKIGDRIYNAMGQQIK